VLDSPVKPGNDKKDAEMAELGDAADSRRSCGCVAGSKIPSRRRGENPIPLLLANPEIPTQIKKPKPDNVFTHSDL
jgi:hypothetical protein